MVMYQQFIVALGSNLGEPKTNLVSAISRLRETLDEDLHQSSFWQSEPQGMPPETGTFLNAVVVGKTLIGAHELLRLLQVIEVEMGRAMNHGSYESRRIDLDIIALGNMTLHDPKLCIPHRHVFDRLFVLQPLAELLPALILPGQDRTVAAMIDQAPDMKISRLSFPPAQNPDS